MINEKKDKNKYIAVLLVLSFAWNSLSYWGGRVIAHGLGLSYTDMTLPFDLVIPLVPVTVLPYFASYLFWFINYVLIATGDKYSVERFFTADFISRVICLLFFVLMPTTLIRPETSTDTAWDTLVTFLYQMDSADNLFPSIHCLVSWFSWIGLRNRNDIPKWYKYLSLVIAIIICISTLTTKQHVVLDLFGGVILAELCYFIAGSSRLRDIYMRPVNRIIQKIS